MASLTASPSTPATYRLPHRDSARRCHGQSSVIPPGHVTAADRQVGAVLDVGDQRRQHRGIVREVGVELDADLGAAFDRQVEPGPVGRPEAGLRRRGRAPRRPRAARRPSRASVGRAVGAGVVDDDDLGLGQRRSDALAHGVDVARLVVGGNDHGHAHGEDSTECGRFVTADSPASVSVRASEQRPLSAIPPVTARVIAFVVILLGGLAGALDRLRAGRPAVRRRLLGAKGLGLLTGAVVCAGGMAIVAVLALRAMGEWREITDRERAGHAPR